MLEDTNGVQVEKVAALQPDLIIGQYSGITKKDYELLSAIAPTVAQPGEYADYGAPWDEMAMNVAKAVGQPDKMQALVDDVKQQIADQAAAHPEFQGKTALVVTRLRGAVRLRPRGPALADAGRPRVHLPERASSAASMDEFGESLSTERVSDLDKVGVAVWLDYEADPAAKKVFEQTATEQEGRWFDIAEADGAYYVAHSFVTPLSIPYVLERYVPQLAAAADGDPSTVPPEAGCLTVGSRRCG